MCFPNRLSINALGGQEDCAAHALAFQIRLPEKTYGVVVRVMIGSPDLPLEQNP
jgi:hypothetical protein